ncbi:MAG TPA: sigma-70 family RNA polymerase sigma factor [Acidobacteriota bacterium]|nr:sigma-70 family RNA polymerase sigma factor [Acidobacteriota bacterium]
MDRGSADDVTMLLQEWRNGSQAALDQLMPLVYRELHRLASIYLNRERAGHTLQPTALIHEAYLKLVRQNVEWQSRTHFYSISANLMRQILVDHARKHLSAKRGGKMKEVTLNEAFIVSPESAQTLVNLDEALNALAVFDVRKARVIELRYISGLNLDEIAEALEISAKTVSRDLRMAEAWLRKELAGKNLRS